MFINTYHVMQSMRMDSIDVHQHIPCSAEYEDGQGNEQLAEWL